MVEFYSEDCRGCQKFAREWKGIAENYKDRSGLVIAQVMIGSAPLSLNANCMRDIEASI